MRKIFTFLMAIFLASTGFAQEVQIGTGTSTSNSVPMYINWNKSYSQQIYLASEIGVTAVNTVTKIAFFHATASTVPHSRDVTIFLKNVTREVFAGASDYEDLSAGVTKALENYPYITGTGNQWVEFELATPFEWDGTSNILVAVIANGTTWANNTWGATNEGVIRAWFDNQDDTDYSTTNPVKISSGNTALNRPNIRLTFANADDCPKPTPSVSSVDISAQVSWMNSAKATGGYTLEYKKQSESDWTVLGSALSSPQTISALEPETDYEVRVKADCGNGNESEWGTISFTTVPLAPVNNLCENAIALSCGSEVLNGTTVSTTPKTIPGNTASPYGVWYTFTGDDLASTITCTPAADYDHEIVVFTGDCGSLTFLSNADNAGVGSAEQLTVNTVAGTHYYVYIARYTDNPQGAGRTGDFTIERGVCVCPTPTGVIVPTEGRTAYSVVVNWAGNADEYIVEYKPTAEEDWANALIWSPNPTTTTVTLDGLTPNTNYQVRVRAVCDQVTDPSAVSNVYNFKTLPTCVVPTNVSAAATSATSGEVTWTAGGTETEWAVEYRPEADMNWIAVSPNPTTNSVALTALTVNTSYRVRVKAVCSSEDQSDWGETTLRTGYCVPAPTSLDGEGIINVSFGVGANVVNHNTGVAARTNNYGDFSNLVGDVEAGYEAPISITYSTGNYGYRTRIYVDWNNDYVFTVPDEQYLLEELSGATDPQTLEATFLIPANVPAGEYRMRIVGTDVPNNGNPCYTGSYGVVEDYTVNVVTAAECRPVSAITVSNIKASVATITWTGSALGYAVEYKKTAESDWTAVTPNPTTASVTLTGLDAETDYEVRIQSLCPQDEVSTWSVKSFKTTPQAKLVPYEQDFESDYSEFTLQSSVSADAFAIGNATGNPDNSLYISSDGGLTNTYTQNNAKIYAVAYLEFPDDADAFNLSFDWKGIGEGTSYDYGGVLLLDPDAALPSSLSEASDRLLGAMDWASESRTLPGADYAGKVKKLVVMWLSDGSSAGGTYDPPIAVDNINIQPLECSAPVAYNTTWTDYIGLPTNPTARTATIVWGENSEVSEYVVEYKKCNDADWTVAPTHATSNTYTFTDLEPDNCYSVRVKSHCGEGFESDYIAENWCFYTSVSCPSVSAITASNITSNSMDIDWTIQGSETQWNIIVSTSRIESVDLPTHPVTYPGVTTKPYPLTQLDPNESYFVYIQADCGTADGTSYWMGEMYPYTTLPEPQTPATLDYTPTLTTNDGWDLRNGGQPNKWYLGSAADGSVADALYIDNHDGATNTFTNVGGQPSTQTNAYAYRTIEFAQAGSVAVSFQWKNEATASNDFIRAFLTPVTANLAPYENNGISGGSIPSDWISLSDNLNNSATYTTINVEIPVSAGEMNLVFFWHSDPMWWGGGAANPAGSVKNISVTALTCSSPTAVTVSNITLSSADIEWTPGASESAWNIIVSPTPVSDFTAVTPTATGLTTPSYTATELDAATIYYVYVQADCGATDGTSNWASATFATPVCAPEEQCTYTAVAYDTFGDGWNGNYFEIKQNGIVVATLELLNGGKNAGVTLDNIVLCSGVPTEIYWYSAGMFPEEVGIELFDADGNLETSIPTGTLGGTPSGSVYAFTPNCVDEVPLTVVATGIEDGAVEVDPETTSITITLNDDVDINGAPDFSGVTLVDGDGNAVAVVVTYEDGVITVTLADGVQLAGLTEYTLTIPDGAVPGLDGAIEITFTTAEITGLGNAETAEIRIYPSITEGKVTIEAPDGSKVKVVDIAGRIIETYDSITFGQTININRAAGTYFVIVENATARKVQKVILK
ncbi:MAG: fibronectin type III domain-containing protein [Prevotellaceae bacterium]|jgi:hypothetical protein|nr:fibronectin type III domain-containing protein [Prevotellaceae bacterium]